MANYSLQFDGSGDYVSCSNPGNFNQYTIEFWFKPAQTWDSSRDGKQGLVHKDDGSDGFFVVLYWDDYGALRFGTNHGNITTSQQSWQPDTWYHIACVQETNSQSYIYVDGQLSSSGDNGYVNYDDTDLIIGSRLVHNEDFEGKIDDVRYWNTARTQTEIQDNKDKELTGTESGLVAYYKFNENTGSTAYDSASSNDGTIYGATWSSDAPALTQTTEVTESRTVTSYVNNIQSTTELNKTAHKQINSYISNIQSNITTQRIRDITVKSYMNNINTNATADLRKHKKVTVNSYINTINSKADRQISVFRQPLSYMNTINTNIILPYLIVSAYMSIEQNNSSISALSNLSNISTIQNPSTVEVI